MYILFIFGYIHIGISLMGEHGPVVGGRGQLHLEAIRDSFSP